MINVNKIKKYLLHPRNPAPFFLARFLSSSFSTVLSDKVFLQLQYHLKTGKKPHIVSPALFNEKIQWLKLYDRKPEYTRMADKYEVRRYIEQTIGAEYLIPLLGVWDSFEDIEFEKLPNQFVLKCTHDSGSILICTDKNKLNKNEAKIYFNNKSKLNYFYHGREWVYKNIKARIIAEKYMADESETELKDYKIFCFNGEPKLIQVDFNRFIEHKRNFYSINWDLLPFELKFPSQPERKIGKPVLLPLILRFAAQLSQNIPFVRVDFYSINSQIFFGELTFYPENGTGEFNPAEWNNRLGSWIVLPGSTEVK